MDPHSDLHKNHARASITDSSMYINATADLSTISIWVCDSRRCYGFVKRKKISNNPHRGLALDR